MTAVAVHRAAGREYQREPKGRKVPISLRDRHRLTPEALEECSIGDAEQR